MILATGPKPRAEVLKLIASFHTGSASEFIDSQEFASDRRRVADTLVAMKLLSSSHELYAPYLVELERGYDGIVQAVKGEELVVPRPVALPDHLFSQSEVSQQPAGNQANDLPEVHLVVEPAREQLDRLNQAITQLLQLPAHAFIPDQRKVNTVLVERRLGLFWS